MPCCLTSFVLKGLKGNQQCQIFPHPPSPLPPTTGLIHAKKPMSNKDKAKTIFQGQIGPLFATELYFMETYRIAILISQCLAFFLQKLALSSSEAILSQTQSSFFAHRILLPLSTITFMY